MSQYRIPKKIPKEDYLAALHWCLRYPQWEKELSTLPDPSRAIRYDQQKVQSSGDYDSTYEMAMKRIDIESKKMLLEEIVRDVDASLYDYLIMGVGYGFTYYQLQEHGIPCGRRQYYERRQLIYERVANKI